MSQNVQEADLLDERLARIPPIVDVDAHVVEPPDVWTSRLPAKYREVGPRVVYAPAGDIKLVGSSYIEAPGTEGPDVAWWFYEDRQDQPEALHRRGRRAGRRGHADRRDLRGDAAGLLPAARADRRHGPSTASQAQMCFPNYPRFCGQIVPVGQGQGARPALRARPTTTGWSRSGAGGSDGRLIPLCIVPLWESSWPPPRSAATPPAGCGRSPSASCRRISACRASTPGYWDPFFAACEETGTVLSHAHRFGHQDPADLRRRTGGGAAAPSSSATPSAAWSTSCSPACCTASRTSSCSTPRRRSAGSPTCWSAPTTSGTPTAAGPTARTTAPSCRRRTTTGRSTAASSRTRSGSACWISVGVDNVMFETDYPHQDGTWPQSREAAALQFGHLPQDQIDKIARGNAIKLLGLELPDMPL